MMLSESQKTALGLLLEGPVTEPWVALHLGAARKRTMQALVSRGLARWHYTSECWRITGEGRALALRVLKEEA